MPIKLIDLSWVLDLPNYRNSLRRWLSLSGAVTPCCQERAFTRYLPVVKPIIHNYHRFLTLNPQEYALYSSLSPKHIATLQNIYQPLLAFIVINLQTEPKPNAPNYQLLSEQEFINLLGQKPAEISMIPLSKTPINGQFNAWSSHLQVQCSAFTSQVIHGKGIAKKQLGFPTANLEVTPQVQERLKQLPNGVFLVSFTFMNGLQYFGVCSIGSNPHYQNLQKSRVVQVYVFNDFGQEQFYGAAVLVRPLILIRLEGKFASFDAFLNAMHNDIYTGMRLAKQSEYDAK